MSGSRRTRVRAAAAERASISASGDACDHTEGTQRLTNEGAKLKNTASTTLLSTGPIGAALNPK